MVTTLSNIFNFSDLKKINDQQLVENSDPVFINTRITQSTEDE